MSDAKDRGSRQRLWMSLGLGVLLTVVAVALCAQPAYARKGRGAGAGGCGPFFEAVSLAEPDDAIFHMLPARLSGGAVITKNLYIQGGWVPGEGVACDEQNQAFTSETDLLNAGFLFVPPQRSGLFNSGGPVLTLAPSAISVTVEHIELNNQDPAVSAGGGLSGVVDSGHTLLLENVAFSRSVVSQAGGGLHLEVHGGQLTIRNSLFFGNEAGEEGGGFLIHIHDGGQVDIENSEVLSNAAGSGGGGRIVMHGGTVRIAGSRFADNESAAGGPLTIVGTGAGSGSVFLFNNEFADNLPWGAPDFTLEGAGVTVYSQHAFLPVVQTGAPQLSAEITDIALNGSSYWVFFETTGFEPELPGQHVHFFFDTVPPEEAGVPGAGPWKLYGGPSPFTGYSVNDRPGGATQLCILVANANHSVLPNSGNCLALP